jgi:limonene 1,2-monooxygenase
VQGIKPHRPQITAENDKAAAALPLTGPGRAAIPAVNAPDLQKEAAKQKKA